VRSVASSYKAPYRSHHEVTCPGAVPGHRPHRTSRHESKRRLRSSPVGQAAIDRFGDTSRQTWLSDTILPLFPQAGVHGTPSLAPSPSNQRLGSPLTKTCQLPGVYSLFVPQIQIAAQNNSLASILKYEGLLDVNGASAQRDLFLFFLFENKCPPFFARYWLRRPSRNTPSPPGEPRGSSCPITLYVDACMPSLMFNV